ncbi:MAG: hypothetical protein RBR35_11365 [Salinivirgaceae bacterium]|jgi:hypothetical protein|nr:hypothetical protein [Salinivirgaceae bacterium]
MGKKSIISISVVILLVVFFSQITFFVIQPIGALPQGKTLVILRMNKTKFIDSADAMCSREMDGVSLLCRGMMMAAIAKKGTILMRLPYSKFLYSISTDGKTYGR